MHQLIPHFILDRLQLGQTHGSIQAATLFVDVSGFTAMTQALMAHDKAGAERLATVINTIYAPVVEAVYAHGGFVAGYAGDALLAIFPGTAVDSLSAATRTAATAKRALASHGRFQFRGDFFQLVLKSATGFGDVEWGIVGDDAHKSWYFRGPAVADCTRLRATVTESAASAPLPAVSRRPIAAVPPAAVSRDMARLFFPLSLWTRPLAGEFRHVVPLFIGFEDGLSWEALNAFATSVMQLTRQFGGLFVEIEHGDKGPVMLIYFGAPIAHDNSVERALDLVLALRSSHSAAAPPRWRAAIASGAAYAGYVGTALRAKYSVLGNTVNLAARLLDRADWGQILVADQVGRQPGYSFHSLEATYYRGYSHPVATAELVGVARPRRDFNQPFFGRRRELQRLLDWTRPLHDGRSPGIALILAEPGVGKSHLAATLEGETTPDQRWLIGYTNQIVPRPFGPFVSILQTLFEQAERDTAHANQSRFETILDRLIAQAANLPGPAALLRALPELQRTRSLLAALLGHEVPPDAFAAQLDTAGRLENSLIALKSLFVALAAIQPTLLLLEDVQALDDASLALLAGLTLQIDDVPLAVLLTARPTDTGQPPALLNDAGIPFQTIALRGLTADALRNLAAWWLGQPIGSALFELLYEKAGANPLMVQEILAFLQTTGALVFDGLVWQLRAEQIELPPGIQSLLMARLDRLPDSVRDVVRTAAVLGVEFDTAVLAAMLRRDISAELDAAIASQVLVPQSFNRARFQHALLRDAAYDMQGRSALRRAHSRAVAAIIALNPHNLPDYYTQLAYHSDRADLPGDAVRYTRLAGQQAARVHDHRAAIHWFSRTLTYVPAAAVTERFALLQQREESYGLLGMRAAQQADLATLEQLAVTLNPASLADVLERQARCALDLSDYEEVSRVAERMVLLGQDRRLLTVALTGHRWHGEAAVRRGAFDEATYHYETALALAQAEADEPKIAACLRGLGLVRDEQGHYRMASVYYSRVLDLYRKHGDLNGEAATLNGLGNVARNMGDVHAAHRYYRQSLACCETLGYRVGQGAVLGNLGNVALDLADFAGARTYFEASYAICSEIGFLEAATNALDGLGTIEMQTGNHAAAERTFTAVRREYAALAFRAGEGTALYNLGFNAYLQGDFDRAEGWLMESYDLTRAIGDTRFAAEAANGLGLVALYRGNLAEAGRLLQAAQDHLGHLNAPTVSAVSRFGLGRVALLEGRLEQAADHFEAARAAFAASSRPHLAVESTAGLLLVALQREQCTAVVEHTSALRSHLQAYSRLEGTLHPYFVLLALQQGLASSASSDALAALETGFQLLRERAAALETPAASRHYLRATAERRAILSSLGASQRV